jgi:hypothetical protein
VLESGRTMAQHGQTHMIQLEKGFTGLDCLR